MALLRDGVGHLPAGDGCSVRANLPPVEQEVERLVDVADRGVRERNRALIRCSRIECGADGDFDTLNTEIDGPVVPINVGDVYLHDVCSDSQILGKVYCDLSLLDVQDCLCRAVDRDFRSSVASRHLVLDG